VGGDDRGEEQATGNGNGNGDSNGNGNGNGNEQATEDHCGMTTKRRCNG
jgi:hypothetical protein